MAYSIAFHDFVYDFPCTPCSVENVNKDSDKFCVDCNQYLCQSCLRSHNKFPDLKKHKLLDKDTFSLGTRSPGGNTSLLDDTCDIHLGKTIEFYCVQDDVVCCSVCAFSDHNDCMKQYIPDIATTFFTAGQVQGIDQEMAKLQEDFKHLKKVRQDHKPRVANDKAAGLRAVKERRKELNANLDKLETQFNKNIIDKHIDIDSKLDSDVKTCDETIELFETFRKNIQLSTNDSRKFLILRRAKQVMKDAETKRNQCQENRNDLMTFALSVPELELSLDLLKKSFGEVNAGYKAPKSLKLEENIKIKLLSDETQCTCSDICQLEDGTIVLVDKANKSVKVLHNDKQEKELESLVLSKVHSCICAVSEQEVAVGSSSSSVCEVQVISVSQKMSLVRSFGNEQNCMAIACFKSLIFTCHYSGNINVYDINGTFIKTIYSVSHEYSLLETSFRMCSWTEKQYLVLTNGCRGLCIINHSGSFITRYDINNVGWIRDICIGEGGNIYIVDSDSTSIRVIGIDKSVTVLEEKLEGKPRSVFYDKKRKQLLVSYECSNHIQRYSLIYKCE